MGPVTIGESLNFEISKFLINVQVVDSAMPSRGESVSGVSEEQEPYVFQRFTPPYPKLVSKNSEMQKVIEKINLVSQTDFTVIIQGETGTGKTMLARLLHANSKRGSKSFVHVDINAIPESLIETELFGHEKGSFTGAHKRKKGFFEIANEGTIFFDDIQNLSARVQGKILSVVEEKKFYPVGNSSPLKVDVRLIAASNVSIRQSLIEKKIREDLFYRLGEFFISIPPLRDRLDDIPLLLERFTEDACKELSKEKPLVSSSVISMLQQYRWPGNVRELKNVIRRAILLCDKSEILPEHIEILSPSNTVEKEDMLLMPLKELVNIKVREVEREAVFLALQKSNGNKKKAAAILNVDYKTLLTKVKEYDIR